MICEEHGGALMLAVGYLSVMTLAASGFLAMLHHRMGVVHEQERAQISRHLAAAGMEAALESIADTPQTVQSHVSGELGEGRFSVSVTPGVRAGEFTLVATGERMYDGIVMHRTELVAEIALDAEGRTTALTWNPEPAP